MWEITFKEKGLDTYEAHKDFHLFSIYSVPEISYIFSHLNTWKYSVRLGNEGQEKDSNLGLSGFHTCALLSSSLYPQRHPLKGFNTKSSIPWFIITEISLSSLLSFSPFQ